MSAPPAAHFIAFEGPDGGGKSTQAQGLKTYLEAAGHDCLLVREPGGTRLGERVREVLLDPELRETDLRAELFLFMACRAQLVAEVIQPALGAGRIVISDRFLLSSMVYQGLVGGLGAETVRTVGDLATQGLVPGLTLILDVPARTGLERVGKTRDRMEQKGTAFHQAIRQGYLDLAPALPRAAVIDGSLNRDAVTAAVRREVDHVLG